MKIIEILVATNGLFFYLMIFFYFMIQIMIFSFIVCLILT